MKKNLLALGICVVFLKFTKVCEAVSDISAYVDCTAENYAAQLAKLNTDLENFLYENCLFIASKNKSVYMPFYGIKMLINGHNEHSFTKEGNQFKCKNILPYTIFECLKNNHQNSLRTIQEAGLNQKVEDNKQARIRKFSSESSFLFKLAACSASVGGIIYVLKPQLMALTTKLCIPWVYKIGIFASVFLTVAVLMHVSSIKLQKSYQEKLFELRKNAIKTIMREIQEVETK